jgi:hypothetical protein
MKEYVDISKITIDRSIHEDIGMTIIDSSNSEHYLLTPRAKPLDKDIEWPKDKLFDPKGITLEDARKAAELCYGKRKE